MDNGIRKRPGSRHVLIIPLICFTLFLLSRPAVAVTIETIQPHLAAKLIAREKENPDFVILDIRTLPEFRQTHLHKAVLVDYYDKRFIEQVKQLDKNKIYLVYCRSGNRSGKALAIFENLGFKYVYNMAEGINGWIRSGFPTEN